PGAVREAWLQTDHLLGLLQAEASLHGARLLIVYVPTKMEVSSRNWDLTARRYRVDERTFDRRRVARLLAETGRRFGVPVLDLTEALHGAARGPGHGPYFEDGGHWNAAGHAVAAREIAAALRRLGWFSCPRSARR